MLRTLRKGILLYVLILVAVGDWLIQHRLASWDETLWVAIYPINGDGSRASREHINDLDLEDLEGLAAYLTAQAREYNLPLNIPVKFLLGHEIAEQPPTPPQSGNLFQIVWWSLQLRWWVWQLDDNGVAIADAKIFVRYFDPEQNPRLRHSLGLQKGRIGIVNAFADRSYRGSNQVVIAHELLHTLGATDKYDPATGLPLYPQGYAQPDRQPRYPQSQAELMGGRIPLSSSEADIPRRLSETLIGPMTAAEIGWQ